MTSDQDHSTAIAPVNGSGVALTAETAGALAKQEIEVAKARANLIEHGKPTEAPE